MKKWWLKTHRNLPGPQIVEIDAIAEDENSVFVKNEFGEVTIDGVTHKGVGTLPKNDFSRFFNSYGEALEAIRRK